jgi:hypothetical protein
MLTLQDCIGLSELTEDEVDAIAEHEHTPEIIAAEEGRWLVETEAGERRIKKMIKEDIEDAQRRGDFRHSAKLKMVLKHFVETHPEVAD